MARQKLNPAQRALIDALNRPLGDDH